MVNLARAVLRALPQVQYKKQKPIILPFGEWSPDLPSLGSPAGPTVKNVIPSKGSYRPFQDGAAVSTALNARCRGAFASKDVDSNTFFYAGTAGKLYDIRNAALTDRSKAGGYTGGDNSVWRFAQQGDTVIATNYDNDVQSATIGTAGLFADMITAGTRKPKAKDVCIFREWVILGAVNDPTDGVVPERVWWSYFENRANFTPSAANLCDFQDIADGGEVKRVIGGREYVIIVQQHALSRMVPATTATIFRIDTIDPAHGTYVSNSLVNWGRVMPFLDEEGFFAFDGIQVRPLGEGKVNRTFKNQFDPNYAHMVSAAIDPTNALYAIAFPGTGSSGGMPNKVWLCYLPEAKWSEVEIDVELVVRAETQAYTMAQLDAVSATLEGLPFPLDSDAWKGGIYRFASFDTDHKLNYHNGSSLAATMDTGEKGFGKMIHVKRARPLLQGTTSGSVALGKRNRQGDTLTFGSGASIDGEGQCFIDQVARYGALRLAIDAGASWDHATGIEVDWAPAGEYIT